ncbi:WYL domain-containing protein [Ralstonia solanacearum]|uniref:helix-turn-helix transcriptional regulator n=1 Tax=Ralstonia solanacearum TaxID=305 RepID=UPI002306C445|nr:WYL domain-containing protein [Ralstonia solanacearum]MDB0510592.1 WYL domain-containing protein [Ralstonia solanacearum]MDB0515097.1 WYL domain-containing protein [Ralstonia solanacearum]
MTERQSLLPIAPQQRLGRSSGRWSQDRRLEFIDFRLRWDGRLNRGDLTAFFGISVPQASLDIARYSELAPGNLEYDRSSRVYVAPQSFTPLFPASDAGRYLNELLAKCSELDAEQSSFLAWAPPVATVPSPGRTFRVEVLVALLRAIREGRAIRVLYQSMTSPQPSARVLTPHALAHDGFRWHARAYCHTRKEFRDFVIARMLEVHGFDIAAVKSDADKEWHTIVPVVLIPHPKLSASHKRAIELDFGMENGQVEFECRQAFLFYALRHLRLDLDGSAKPEAQQIALKNQAAIKAFMLKTAT